jgi:hypothetical protein
MKLRIKDKTKKDNPMSKGAIVSKVHEKARAKGSNATAEDVYTSFDTDNIEIRDELNSLCERGEIFFYKGEFYPWRDLEGLYDKISAEVYAIMEQWYKTYDTPLDAVHIMDYPKDFKYYEVEGKICISWKALVWVCKQMERRGEVATV